MQRFVLISVFFHWQEQRNCSFLQCVHFAQRDFSFQKKIFFHKLPQIILLLYYYSIFYITATKHERERQINACK